MSPKKSIDFLFCLCFTDLRMTRLLRAFVSKNCLSLKIRLIPRRV